MSTVILELSRKQLEILYASFKRYLDPSTPVLVPENATLDEMNELSEKLKKELDKKSDKT
ncbi:MAG: hypothetical protein ACRD8Z_24385 [Nitrososphaeraceae archaeon]